MSDKSGVSSQIISLPKGGGALQGIGEKFSPDLHTGTGNFTVPIALLPGRNGFQPQLNLVYSTGNGNGPFGLGWDLGIPGVRRKTAKAVPLYNEANSQAELDRRNERRDVFILSGTEDLVPIKGAYPGSVRYRPRTEGLFARIEHHLDSNNDFWEVRSKDGLISQYGTPSAAGSDEGVVTDPADKTKVFNWKLTQTTDPFGNCIEYTYLPSSGSDGPHHWDQSYLQQISYADHVAQGVTAFLVSVTFEYETRPDPYSDYRSGFEIRTTQRCTKMVVKTHVDRDRTVREYRFKYDNAAANGVSLLSQVEVIGYDDEGHPYDGEVHGGQLRERQLPPLKFGYSRFEPQQRRDLLPITGSDLPPGNLGRPEYELADLTGDGLPDVLEMNGTVRYWRNLGAGRFDLPRLMRDAPPVALADPGVQMIDADGDGRADLLVTDGQFAGYYPLTFEGTWARESYQRYGYPASFNFEDPEVNLVDLDGDGLTDVIRSGTRLECFFNDPDRRQAWTRTTWVERRSLDVFPNVNFSDPRVKWGDMNGDNLQDIVLLYDGNVEYWPNLGHGRWGNRIHMANNPHFREYGYTFGYDPRRILVGDVDGDGLADIVYVGIRQVTLWINQSGNRWSDPIVIPGTPPVTDMDAVRLVDLLGTGISGVLWSSDATGNGRPHCSFLDFTGGAKPYMLHEMDNHLGATTRVEYAPSTRYLLEDRATREPWKTTLPFPVQVVARVEVLDHLSQGKLTTEYRYHQGYWDGAEREFRGFGIVEQLDTETFDRYNATGLHGETAPFERVDDDQGSGRHRKRFFSQPTLTRTWFHQGPVGPEFGAWQADLDLSESFWDGDPQLLDPWEHINRFLATDLSGSGPRQRRMRRDALRTLRGSVLRTELYALDRYENQDRIDPELDRPYTVTESQYALVEIDVPAAGQEERTRIFFPHLVAQRTTQWERGDDPMTQFTFTDYRDDAGQPNPSFDAYGRPHRQTQIACPRGWRRLSDIPSQPFLATRTITDYVGRDDAARLIVDRMKRITAYEFDPAQVAGKTLAEVLAMDRDDPALRCIGQTINRYDDQPYGQLDDHAALTHVEVLALTSAILSDAFGSAVPPYLNPNGAQWPSDYPAAFQARFSQPGYALAGYHYHDTAIESQYETGYFVLTRHEVDPRHGLLLAQVDPLGNRTTITYDHDLLPATVTDPRTLTTRAEYNYRTLQPSLVTDPNGNRTAISYSPSGLPLSLAVMGRPGEHRGDRRAEPSPTRPAQDYPSVLFQYDLLAFEDRLEPASLRTLKRQTHFWDIVRAENERRRANGQMDLTEAEVEALFPANEQEAFTERFIEVCEYSDGFGRLLQTRTQAEDVLFGDPVFGNGVVPADAAANARAVVKGTENRSMIAPNVVVSGWQTYDNKGRVVEKYEPAFDTGWAYDPPSSGQGEKAILFYDPRGQVICTVNPDGSEQRVIYGVPGTVAAPDVKQVDASGRIEFEPTPWEAYTYDANDLAPVTVDPDGASLASRVPTGHHFTPSSIEIDALGRTVKAVQRLGAAAADQVVTRSVYDIRGNLLQVIDALGRTAFSHVFDLADRRMRLDSIDAGPRWTVFDAAGNVIEARDNKGTTSAGASDGQGALVLRRYDELSRPTHLWARDQAGVPMTLRERLVYGDDATPGLSIAEVESGNLLGKLYRHYDEAGVVIFAASDPNSQLVAYDFRGNMLEKRRLVVGDAALAAGWTADWSQANAENVLDPADYQTSSRFDALNRPTAVTYPKDVNGHRAILQPAYNRAGALEAVMLDGQTYVERIAYNARGQRTLIAYRNGVLTRYAYDLQTFRLARLRTEHYSVNGVQYQPSGPVRQDLTYDYDLAGNITRITDRAPGGGVRGNPDALLYPALATELGAGDALIRGFVYDPFYRLVEATGRQAAQLPVPCTDYDPRRQGYNWSGQASSPSPENARDVTQLYTERYSYDPAGNLLSLSRTGSGTRYFGMGGFTPEEWLDKLAEFQSGQQPDWGLQGNRLTNVGSQTAGQTHRFDANGNLVQENTERHFTWDRADRMVGFKSQPTTSCTASVEARYLYDASGMRVKKWVRTNGTANGDSTIYIDGVFEHHRWKEVGQPGTKQNTRLHVMDDQSRIALVRIGDDIHKDDKGPQIQYHLGDHLGSSHLVFGGSDATSGDFVNREEYTPYGETSFGSFGKKRYRFTGRERDEESGLSYHQARYYAPWLARWASCDPAGTVDGPNLYTYARNSPLVLTDTSGKAGKKGKGSSKDVTPPKGWNTGPVTIDVSDLYDRPVKGTLKIKVTNAAGNHDPTFRQHSGLVDETGSFTLPDSSLGRPRTGKIVIEFTPHTADGNALETLTGYATYDDLRTGELLRIRVQPSFELETVTTEHKGGSVVIEDDNTSKSTWNINAETGATVTPSAQLHPSAKVTGGATVATAGNGKDPTKQLSAGGELGLGGTLGLQGDLSGGLSGGYEGSQTKGKKVTVTSPQTTTVTQVQRRRAVPGTASVTAEVVKNFDTVYTSVGAAPGEWKRQVNRVPP